MQNSVDGAGTTPRSPVVPNTLPRRMHKSLALLSFFFGFLLDGIGVSFFSLFFSFSRLLFLRLGIGMCMIGYNHLGSAVLYHARSTGHH